MPTGGFPWVDLESSPTPWQANWGQSYQDGGQQVSVGEKPS